MTVHATNHSANLGPSLRLELELTPPKDSADPRGPFRKYTKIERTSSATLITFECGHIGSFNPIYDSSLDPEHRCFQCGPHGKDSPPNIAARDSAATKAGSAGDQECPVATVATSQGVITGQPASPLKSPGHSLGGHPLVPPFPPSFYRPRFIVLPTGRTMLAWGIWDCQKNPLGSLPTCIFKMSDFVHRTRSLGKAYAFARRLNEKHERKAAA